MFLYISGIFTVIRNDTSAIPGEVSYHFVVRANDGTQYVLQVHEQATPATFDFQVGVEISNTRCSLLELRERIIQQDIF